MHQDQARGVNTCTIASYYLRYRMYSSCSTSFIYIYILLLPAPHRIYHWTYKHFCCGFGGFFSPCYEKHTGFLLLAALSSHISWYWWHLKVKLELVFLIICDLLLFWCGAFLWLGLVRWSLRNWNKQTWLST